MKYLDANVGVRVRHEEYGDGTLLKTEHNQYGLIRVLFDSIHDDLVIRVGDLTKQE